MCIRDSCHDEMSNDHDTTAPHPITFAQLVKALEGSNSAGGRLDAGEYLRTLRLVQLPLFVDS
eukprot:1022664-Pyramimonas_sp.AAC.1